MENSQETGSRIRHALIKKGAVVVRLIQSLKALELYDYAIDPPLFRAIEVSAFSIAVGKGENISRYYAIYFSIPGGGDAGSGYLDYDEIEELISGVKVVKTSMKKLFPPSAFSKNVCYRSRDEIEIGFIQAEQSHVQKTYFDIQNSLGYRVRFRKESDLKRLDWLRCKKESEGDYGNADSQGLRTGLPLPPPPLPSAESTDLSAEVHPAPTQTDFDALLSMIQEGREILNSWRSNDGMS